jgi:thymidylate kinase
MQRIIIFDGPDGCGKTEMGKELSKRTGIPYFRMATQHENWRTGKFKEALEFDQTYIAEFLKQTCYSAIIDRAYPSEWVYSSVFKRETNPAVLRSVDGIFSELGADIIIPVKESYERNREDEVIPSDKYKAIHDKYIEFSKWTRCRAWVMNVDSLGCDIEREIKFLATVLER